MTHPPFAVILGSRFGIRSRPGTEAGDEGIPGGASTGDRSNVATACRCHGRAVDREATDARHRTVLPRPPRHGVSESGNAGRAEGAQGRELLRISKARRTTRCARRTRCHGLRTEASRVSRGTRTNSPLRRWRRRCDSRVPRPPTMDGAGARTRVRRARPNGGRARGTRGPRGRVEADGAGAARITSVVQGARAGHAGRCVVRRRPGVPGAVAATAEDVVLRHGGAGGRSCVQVIRRTCDGSGSPERKERTPVRTWSRRPAASTPSRGGRAASAASAASAELEAGALRADGTRITVWVVIPASLTVPRSFGSAAPVDGRRKRRDAHVVGTALRGRPLGMQADLAGGSRPFGSGPSRQVRGDGSHDLRMVGSRTASVALQDTEAQESIGRPPAGNGERTQRTPRRSKASKSHHPTQDGKRQGGKGSR
jgi:hypothetical protein